MIMKHPHLPLAPAAFYILFALSDGEKHGYAIMRDARAASDNGLDIGPATLYTTIQRLLDSGWIAEAESPKDSDSRRRYYGLTKDGNATLEAELKRMESIVKKSKALRLRSARSAS
jgi:DNA-binding PadR family transcriptional regulator